MTSRAMPARRPGRPRQPTPNRWLRQVAAAIFMLAGSFAFGMFVLEPYLQRAGPSAAAQADESPGRAPQVAVTAPPSAPPINHQATTVPPGISLTPQTQTGGVQRSQNLDGTPQRQDSGTQASAGSPGDNGGGSGGSGGAGGAAGGDSGNGGGGSKVDVQTEPDTNATVPDAVDAGGTTTPRPNPAGQAQAADGALQTQPTADGSQNKPVPHVRKVRRPVVPKNPPTTGDTPGSPAGQDVQQGDPIKP